MMPSTTTSATLLSTLLAMAMLLLPDHVQSSNVSAEMDFSSIVTSYASIKQQFNELLNQFEDEDYEAPPGPPGGWQHTIAFSTTKSQQEEYQAVVEEQMYVQYQEQYFAAYGGKDVHGIHQTRIARPESSTTGYYTGVTHFHHVNNPHLVTFLFSAGRHDGGTNTYLTIDISEEENKNPFPFKMI